MHLSRKFFTFLGTNDLIAIDITMTKQKWPPNSKYGSVKTAVKGLYEMH